MGKMIKIVLVITCIAGFSGIGLTALSNSLSSQIESQVDIFVRGPALVQIMENMDNDPVNSRKEIALDEVTFVLYPGFKDGKCVAAAFESVGPGGYGGDVTLMVGFNLENSTILGIGVTDHSETPGIGTRALVVSYLSAYFGTPYSGTYALTSEGGSINALTGATFTSTAIVRAVEIAAQIIREHQQEIIETLENNHENN